MLEQNFQFDLVSSEKLLLRYLDRPITVERTLGGQVSTLSGTLLSSVDGLVLRGAVRVLALSVLFPLSSGAQEASALPDGNAYVRSVLRDASPQDAAINDYAYDVLESRETLTSASRFMVRSRYAPGRMPL